MKRWDASNMLAIGRKLFLTTHRRKKLVHANHEIHFMAREIDDWLPAGIQSLIDGNYDPRHLKRRVAIEIQIMVLRYVGRCHNSSVACI